MWECCVVRLQNVGFSSGTPDFLRLNISDRISIERKTRILHLTPILLASEKLVSLAKLIKLKTRRTENVHVTIGEMNLDA